MLVLSREKGESVILYDAKTKEVLATIIHIDTMGSKVRLGFEAPAHIVIDREEVYIRKLQNKKNGKE